MAGEIASLDEIPVASKAAGLIGLLASLNIALFVFNLIPLLPLDGGHIAGALWEAIRRGFAKLFRRPDPGPVDLAKLMPLTLAVVVVLGAHERAAHLRRHREAGVAVLMPATRCRPYTRGSRA